MNIGNTDAATATSTVGSKGRGSRHLMSKPSGLKWQASASASKSSDAAASSTSTELSHVGQEQETDADAATSTVGSDGKVLRCLLSQPCGLKRRACSSKSADASTSSTLMELSHSGLERGHVSMKASSSPCNWKWYDYPWATIRTNDPIFRSMASFVVGESESKKLDSLPLSQLLSTALAVFNVFCLQMILVELGGSNFGLTKDELIARVVSLLMDRENLEMTDPKCDKNVKSG